MTTIRTGLFLLLLILTACSPSSESLTGEWQLTKLNGSDIVPNSKITIVFSDQGISGSGGCNSYSGEYSIKNGKINFSELTMTLMACLDEKLNDQETSFFIALNQVDKIKVTDKNLSLTDSGVSLEFIKSTP